MCILLGILLVVLGIAFLWLLHSYRNKMKLIKSLRLDESDDADLLWLFHDVCDADTDL